MDYYTFTPILDILNGRIDTELSEKETTETNSLPNVPTYYSLLNQFYNAEDSVISSRAFKLILEMSDVDKINFIQKCLVRDELGWRYAACKYLEFVNDNRAVNILETTAQNDRDPNVRYEAIRVLGLIGTNESLQALEYIVQNDKDYDYEGFRIKHIAEESISIITNRMNKNPA